MVNEHFIVVSAVLIEKLVLDKVPEVEAKGTQRVRQDWLWIINEDVLNLHFQEITV